MEADLAALQGPHLRQGQKQAAEVPPEAVLVIHKYVACVIT